MKIMTVAVASELPNMLERGKVFHFFCSLLSWSKTPYSYYHETCSYQRSHGKPFP